MLIIPEPSKVYLRDYEAKLDEVKHLLTYQDKSVDYQISKFRHAKWFRLKYGEEKFQERLAELKAERLKCLLAEDSNGLYAPSGLAPLLQDRFDDQIQNQIVYPEPKLIPWAHTPEYQMYPYQEEALEALLEAKHAGVEIGTGLGKSFIAVNVVKRLGLPTLIMTPSTNISEQLYEDFVRYFGPARVGAFFDGKKQFKKDIVIANGQSLVRLEPGDAAYEALAKKQVFISDESHYTPAATFNKVCFGVAAKAPYRFFFSATQMRNDGAGLLLQGITGPIVYKKTVQEGVDEGYLAKPVFRMITTHSSDRFDSKDAMEMTRRHLFYNERVNQIAADIANKSVSLLGHPVLILIEEMEQFAKLLPHLRHKVGFAHGALTPENSGKIPAIYHKSDPKALVDEFNRGEIPILIGTSCVSTGTNFKAVRTLIYLQGGRSEIQVRQAVGRATRLFEDKKACAIYDFNVSNVGTTNRHAIDRMSIYDEIYGPVQEVSYV